jgi:ribosomal-protein-alanine N-acetyltransferase
MNNFEVPTFIQGENIDLLPLNLEHIKLYSKWKNDPKVRKYARNEFPLIIEDIKEFSKPHKEEIRKEVEFEIWHKKDKKPIGIGGLSRIDWYNRNANIFLEIGESNYWGKNIGTEASRMIIDYGFKELNLHKIYAGIYSPNKGSLKVAEKQGFKLEATLKEQMYVDGKYVDSIRYGIFKEEWMNRNK